VKPEADAQGSRSTRGLQATGKTGRVNASEPLTTLRYAKPGEGGGSAWAQGWADGRRPATAGVPVPALWRVVSWMADQLTTFEVTSLHLWSAVLLGVLALLPQFLTVAVLVRQLLSWAASRR
jgi:hypothetical protein